MIPGVMNVMDRNFTASGLTPHTNYSGTNLKGNRSAKFFFCIKKQVLTSITTCQSIRSQNTVVSELQAVKTAKFRLNVGVA